MRRIVILLFIFIATVSCEKFLDMEIPDKGRKMVLNCFFNDNDTLIVDLSKSVFILDNSNFNPIKKATVNIFENSNLVATCTEFEGGKYKAIGFIPQKEKKYKIEVIQEGDTLTSISTIPSNVPFSIVDTSVYSRDYESYFRVKLSLNDPAGVKNYYMINFSLENTMDLYENNESYIYFSSEDKVIETFYESNAVFSDDLFNGKTKNITFDLSIYDFWNDTNKLKITLYSLSEEMYLYIVSLMAQQETSFSPFAEPVIVFNNIQNGYGIFAGYSSYTDSLIVPKLNNYIYEINE